MAIEHVHRGQTVRIRTTTPFTNAAGVATDPATITLKIEAPDGTETSYTYAAAEVTKAATGDYYRDVALDTSGVWAYRWVGAGNGADAVDEDVLYVRESAFAAV